MKEGRKEGIKEGRKEGRKVGGNGRTLSKLQSVGMKITELNRHFSKSNSS